MGKTLTITEERETLVVVKSRAFTTFKQERQAADASDEKN